MWRYANANGDRQTFNTLEELKKYLPMPCGKKLLLDFDEVYSKSRLIQKAKVWGGQVWAAGNDTAPLFEITQDATFITEDFNR